MTTDCRFPGSISAAAALASLILTACGSSSDDSTRHIGVDSYLDLSGNQASICGNIRIDFIDTRSNGSDGQAGPSYLSIFRRDANYSGMEDNDIRGFLDGVYKEGWNQVSQVHLRLGRRGRNPAFGEYELFRNLQRWADLPVPRLAVVEDATIELSLESGPPYPVDIAVYAVHKDWNPGGGGVNNDNNGPPKDGEVWWLDAKYDELAWSRPGAGHASDHDPRADTGAEPLAISRYTPDAPGKVSFASSRLTHYINAQIHAGEPVLLLYKLTDVYEDSPGSVLEIWSANAGVDGSERRPSLQLRWHSALPTVGVESPVALESGRYRVLPNVATGGERIAVTLFSADTTLLAAEGTGACGGQPFVEYRPAASDHAWRELSAFQVVRDEIVDLRISATVSPVPLGQSFAAEIRDTWVPQGAPENRSVVFEFHSPNGAQIAVNADYIGDFRWRASFEPDALGQWAYQWRHALAGHDMVGELRQFDVVAWEHGHVIDGLKALEHAIVTSGAAPKSYAMLPHELSFMRLERAAMQLDDTGMSKPESEDLFETLRRIRALLSGTTVPTTLTPKPIKSRETGGDR